LKKFILDKFLEVKVFEDKIKNILEQSEVNQIKLMLNKNRFKFKLNSRNVKTFAEALVQQ